jgi:cytochrome P450
MGNGELRLESTDFAVEALPNLHEVLAELRAVEPVSRILFAGKPIWLVNDYETVRRHIGSDDVLSAPAAYGQIVKPSMGNVLPTMTGKQHRLNRAVVSRVFFPGRMREYAESMFAEEAEKLADTLEGQSRVDLVGSFTRSYTFNNIARLLGLPARDVVRLQDWADRIMRSYVDVSAARAAGQEMGDYLLPIVKSRRVQPKDDVLSLLAQAEVEGEGLSDDEILGFCRNLFPAAIDTSTNSLGSLLVVALRDRELWRALPRNQKLREDAVYELLRWEPPLVMIPRRAVHDLELGGQRLSAGDDVRLCITGAHDDPRQFPEPRSFKLDRGVTHLAFGHGEHFCLGTQMARRVVEKGVEVLGRRFPEMTLCPDEKAEILGGVLRGPRTLKAAPLGLC